MPATVIRSDASRLTLIEARVESDDMGLVRVLAQWLAPQNAPLATFLLDQAWPIARVPVPRSMPRNFGGPWLLTQSSVRRYGLEIVETVWVTAAAPIVIREDVREVTRDFSATEESNGVTRALSFRYRTQDVTRTWCRPVGSKDTATRVKSVLQKRWNISGGLFRPPKFNTIYSLSRSPIGGRLERVTLSTEGVFEIP
jgi:hypothetical protein